MDVRFSGPAGGLEGILDEPEGRSGAPSGVAVVCHPHPVHGGTMRNTVVFRAARALRSAGLVTLRFNFRGVEGSEGEHDGSGGEEDDVVAALDFLAERYPGLPAWAAGYSFGSRTVGRLAVREPRIERLILIAFPLAAYDCSFLGDVRQPAFLLFGSGDEFGTLTELAREFPGLPERFEADEILGADHFFRGRTPLLEERIRAYAQRSIERSE